MRLVERRADAFVVLVAALVVVVSVVALVAGGLSGPGVLLVVAALVAGVAGIGECLYERVTRRGGERR